MPRLIFKIGIEGYFMLELQLGSPSLTAGTINTDESNPEPAHGATPAIPDDKLLPSQAPHNMTVSSTEEPVLSNTTPACGNISVLPSEIRMIICKMLLTPDALIYDAHTLIDVKQSLVPSQIPRIQGLDARLLRTCRKVYEEALPVLYQKNDFYFCIPRGMTAFAHNPLWDLLASEPSKGLFGYIVAPYGRFGLIRSVVLRLGPPCQYSSLRSRAYLTENWHSYFEEHESSRLKDEFPALERLVLDLSDWRPGPGEEEALNMQPLIQKMGREGGLQELTVVGLVHWHNLADLKKGLVRSGGRFQVVNRPNELNVVELA